MATVRGPYTDPEVVVRIAELAGGHTAAAIERQLTTDPAFAARAPSLRTIERIARSLHDSSGSWSVLEASPGEAALVLPVLGFLAASGTVHRLSREMATWIARIARAAPWLGPSDLFRFAVRYRMAAIASAPTDTLDLELARTHRNAPPA